MTHPPLAHVNTPDVLPDRAEVVVIGGGIVGAATAFYLAQAGVEVLLLEKGRVGAEQSSRNWGWCRQQNRDARELPMATHALALWDRLDAETGAATGFRRCGLTYVTDDPAELAGWAAWIDFARPLGIDSRVLSRAAATEAAHATGRPWLGGIRAETDGVADPGLAVPALAQGILRHGGRVVQMCAARGLDLAAGRVAGVVTERGRVSCAAVVMAGGAWASSFVHQVGVSFPQASVRQSILRLAHGANGLPDAFHTAAVSLTRRADGSLNAAISGRARLDPTPQALRYARQFVPMYLKRRRSLAPGGPEAWQSGYGTRRRWRLDAPTPMERVRILAPRPDPGAVRRILDRARATVPALAGVGMREAWAGYIDSTPDGVPVISEVAGIPGLVIAAGFSGHGFGIGPGAGHLAARLVRGETAADEVADYRLDRFDHGVGAVAEF